MEIPRIQVRRRVFVAIGLLLVVTGVWRYWAKNNKTLPGDHATGPKPFVQVVGKGQQSTDREIQERTELFDPTPLFIPTGKNFGQGGLPARVVRQPGQVFGTYDPKLNFTDSGLDKYGNNNDLSTETLPELVSRGNEVPFGGFGQVDSNRLPLAARVGYVEIKSLKTGLLYLSETFSQLKLPVRDYAPAEFVVVVGAAGLIGEPVLTAGSGSDEDDVALREFLVKGFHLGEKLPPGRYAVTVGP
jgi:hypothetical protein